MRRRVRSSGPRSSPRDPASRACRPEASAPAGLRPPAADPASRRRVAARATARRSCTRSRERPRRFPRARGRSGSVFRPAATRPLLGPEAIARAAHREDQLGIARIPLDLLAQVADVDVDRARLAVVRPAPQSLQELAPREHDAGALREDDQHLELDERELDGLPANVDCPSGNVDPELAPLDELLPFSGEVRRRGAPEECAHAAPELADRERLRDVVVRPELEPENLVELLAAGGEHDDRDVALPSQALAHLEPVESWEHHIEHHEIDCLLAETPKCLFSVARLDDGVAVPLEGVREQGLNRVLVVDEENCRSVRHRTRGRRLRRGTVERPLNSRLVRIAFLVVAPAVVAFLFSISTTGTLPRSTLAPIFDGGAAATLADTLSVEYPSRVPGSEGAVGAAHWYAETVRSLGLTTEEDVWSEDLADLGRVDLRNVVTVVPGRSDDTIVTVAHRDNAGTERPLGDNASGTAALIELARAFAPQAPGPDLLPQHTLVFVSTDAGAYGGAGAERFADSSPLAERAIAVVVLDGLGERGPPRIAIAGDEPASPARALVRTAGARIEEQSGIAPSLPNVPTQLLDLGLSFAGGEQGRFLGHGIAAVTLGTKEQHDPVGDPAVRVQRLGQLGRATEALLDSLDTSAGGAFRTPDTIFFADRAASGWTARLVLVLAVVPFALGLADLLVRARRRRLPLAPALRAQRARLGVALFGGALVWLGAHTGVFPTGAALPLPPYADVVAFPPVGGLLLLAGFFVIGWLVARGRLAPVTSPSPGDRLAGLVVGLALVGVVAIVLAMTKPYALVFVLPSLYAWLWLPLEGRSLLRVGMFLLGLAGPIIGLVLLGEELGISPVDATLYAVALITVGY